MPLGLNAAESPLLLPHLRKGVSHSADSVANRIVGAAVRPYEPHIVPELERRLVFPKLWPSLTSFAFPWKLFLNGTQVHWPLYYVVVVRALGRNGIDWL